MWIDLFEVETVKHEGRKIVRYKTLTHRLIWPAYWNYLEDLYPLQEVPFDDITIAVPKTPNPYLERAYGNDWRVPKVWSVHT